MSADQTAAELTTRDVLLQVDRRLTLIEEDLRSLDNKVDGLDDKLDSRIGALEVKLDSRITALDDKMGSRIEALRNETGGRFDRVNTRIDEVCTKLDAKIDSKFHQLVGILLVTWISTMVTVLLK